MNINVAMELSKNEIVNSINEVSEKYKLPSCLLNQIMQSIAVEVNNIANNDLKKDLEEYQRQQNMKLYKEVKQKEKESEK